MDKQERFLFWSINIATSIGLIFLIMTPIVIYMNMSHPEKPKKPSDPNIVSTIRLKETGCTYLVFSDGQIVPEYGVDGKVVGCGE